MENQATTHHTHIVSYRGSEVPCSEADFDAVCKQLIDKHGPSTQNDFPRVAPISPTPFGLTKAPEAPKPIAAGEMDLTAKARIAGQQDLALTAGFAPKPPIYSAGTRVNSTGVENATRMQVEHDAKPLATDLAKSLCETVLAEKRQDTSPVPVSLLRMNKAGNLVLPSDAGEPGRGQVLPVNERAFTGLFSRMPCRSGIAYLSDCSPELRAINLNHWAVELGRREAQEQSKTTEVVLRTRSIQGARQAFAAVSKGYTAFDADKIGAALTLAFPEDARGTLDYDGQRMRIEGLWRTNIAPGEFAAGEFFKAGVVIRADDTGAGSIRVQSVLWRNLCLNLIILDKAIGVDIRIKHMGSVEALAVKFREAFSQALSSVDGFRKAWGYAMKEKDEVLAERVRAAMGDEVKGMTAREMLPGLFNGLLDAELVPIKGRRTDVIPKLLEMHRQDEAADVYGVSRASVVNAITRYAHTIETDPFAADEIRESAGALLSGYKGRDPRPLPYLSVA